MKHLLIKFNHGVEIGARLAYLGHYERTKDPLILKIADEEREHMIFLENILSMLGEKPTWLFDLPFTVVGKTVGWLCKFAPIFTLDFVARTMELFAIINYDYLARLYPDLEVHFSTMALVEEKHKEYFTRAAS
jgi:rubrerythrin